MLAEGDYVQASEKFWGAVATMVKVVAETQGWRHHGHADLGRAVRNVAIATGDEEIPPLFRSAEQLHANFYENFLEPSAVTLSSQGIFKVLEKLQRYLDEKRDFR